MAVTTRARLEPWLWGGAVPVLLVGSWVLSYQLGGTAHFAPHWFYVPIMIAAARFPAPVVFVTALAAAVLAGPLVPAVVSDGLAQQPTDWVVRGSFFILLGLFVHTLFVRLQRAVAREHADVERLKVLDQERVRMLTAVSHEVRTPLTSVLGFAQTIWAGAATLPRPQIEEMARRLDANADRLMKLLGGLLELDAEVPDANRVATDLAPLAGSVLSRLDMGGRSVTPDLRPALCRIDAGQVERLVEALLDNARRHTEPSVPIWMRTYRDGDEAVLEVEDAGDGVPAELRDHIFEPFRQGDSISPHSPGAGLGLAVALRLARAHGGSLSVDERPGGGARFVLRLPAVGDA